MGPRSHERYLISGKSSEKTAHFVTSNYDRNDSVTAMLKELKWQTLQELVILCQQ